jgi:hypothetical protein
MDLGMKGKKKKKKPIWPIRLLEWELGSCFEELT